MWKDFFYYTKSERRVILLLLAIALLLLGIWAVMEYLRPVKQEVDHVYQMDKVKYTKYIISFN
jgi:lipopolysaccharide export system protein LptC